MTEKNSQKLGIVVSGSLDKGVEVRLDSPVSVEDMVVGRYVTIEGEKRRFFGMITDISLGVLDQKLTLTPPDTSDLFMTEVLAGTSTYGTIHVSPYLTIGGDATSLIEGPQPVKTVPGHFSTVNLASDQDIELVFGKEDEKRFFIGNPLDMETKLCLNLEEFVKRSNGIFGKSGTGKTFLTRILLIGMLQKSKAVNLVFDMHNEYGWAGTREGGPPVKALKQLFPSNVAVFTLDEENSRRRGVSTDAVVKIGYDEIEPEDIRLLRQTLNLTELAAEAVYQLYQEYGKDWLQRTVDLKDPEDIKTTIVDKLKIHESTFQNLRRGLATIRRLHFIEPHAPTNAVNDILEYLDRGINVVLEFGRYRDITAYILVANMLSRRIYARYLARMEKAEAAAEESAKPHPLVITIEEAHKFLNPEVANQTIFGTIAREMRKYNVTLLVIDQRPSGIDEEVMS
ncbi:helicase HerA domain-containing protein, partial [Chloroflexota bacterium]